MLNIQEIKYTLLLSVIMSSRLFGLFMIFPLFSVEAINYLGVTPFLIGLSIGIYGLTQAIFQLPFGMLSDKLGRKPLIIIGILIFIIGSLVVANAQHIIWVVVGRGLQGCGAVSAVLLAYLSDLIRPVYLSYANALYGMIIGIAFISSVLLGPILFSSVGLSGLFILVSVFAVFTLVGLLWLPTVKMKINYRLNWQMLLNVFNVSLLKFYCSIFMLHFIFSLLFLVLPIYLQNYQIITIEQSWRLYFPVMLVSLLLMLPILWITEKTKRYSISIFLGIVLIGSAGGGFYYLSPTYWMILIVMTIFFIGFNLIESLLPSLVVKQAGRYNKGIIMGMFSLFQFISIFFGGIAGGYIYGKYGQNSVFLLIIFTVLIWLLLQYMFSINYFGKYYGRNK